MSSIHIHINIYFENTEISFQLGQPISVSRTIKFNKHSSAFNLPHATSTPFNYKNVFIGDVLQGGSCNVDVLSFCPHNLTHVETSDHILNQTPAYASISTIPQHHLQGLLFAIDLRKKLDAKTKFIKPEHIKAELESVQYPINALALITHASDLSADFNFTGKDFLALHKDTLKLISDFSCKGRKVTSLILDLPSTDPEDDGGKLLAHRSFFEIPETGIEFTDHKKKVIAELAYFTDVVQNYYYFIMTPARIQSNAMVTDILFYPLINQT